MSLTNIEHFNNYLKLFINNIISTFPEYKDILENYYDDLLESEKCNNDKYVKRYMTKMQEYKKNISDKNCELFKDNIYILKNIDFKNIWESGELTDNNKEKIWEYLQTLYILGETIINSSEKITNLVKKFKKINIENNDTDNTNNNDNTNEDINEDDELLKMFKNLSEETKNEVLDENFIENGIIGKLANELTEELDLNNLNLENSENVSDVFTNLVSSENSLKFMDLIQNVGQKIQTKVKNGEFNQDQLFNEAKRMMGSFQNSDNMNLFNNLMNESKNTPTNPTQERLRKKLEKKKETK